MAHREPAVKIQCGGRQGTIWHNSTTAAQLDHSLTSTDNSELWGENYPQYPQYPQSLQSSTSTSSIGLPIPTPHTMLRTAAVRALRAASTPRIIRQVASARPQALNSFLRSSPAVPSLAVPSIRFYSAPAGLSKDEVQGRIMDLLKNFDKVCWTRNIPPLFGD